MCVGCNKQSFLSCLLRMGKATKGTTAGKQTKVARRENILVKKNAAASNEPINFREKMIMAISEIGHVSLFPLIIS